MRSNEEKTPALRLEGFEGDWNRDEFGRVFTFLPTNTLSRADLNSSGYGVLNIHYGDVLTKFGNVLDVAASQVPVITKLEAVESFSPASFLRNGDVVIADTAEDETVGKTTEIQEIRSLQVVSGLHTYACRPIIGFAPWFLGQMLNSRFVHSQIILKSQGTKVTSISKQALSTVEVIFPFLPEQQAIGAFFRNLDSIIEQSAVRQKSLTSLKKTMLVKMFPQGTSSTPEVRFEGFEGDWETVALGEIGSIKTGPFGSTLHADDYVAHGTPIITTEHFKTGNLEPYSPSLPQVSEADRSRLSGYTLDEGDIVFSRVGSVDVNAVIRAHQAGWLFSGRVLRVRLYGAVDTEYLHWSLLTPRLRRDVTDRAVGQTMPSINTTILAETVVPVPSLPEQQAIGAFFRNLDTLIDAEEKKLTTLRNLKSALLTQMFV